MNEVHNSPIRLVPYSDMPLDPYTVPDKTPALIRVQGTIGQLAHSPRGSGRPFLQLSSCPMRRLVGMA